MTSPGCFVNDRHYEHHPMIVGRMAVGLQIGVHGPHYELHNGVIPGMRANGVGNAGRCPRPKSYYDSSFDLK